MKNFTFILVLIFLGLSNATTVAQGSWSLQTNPTSAEGESMQFVSATEGWISLTSNQLLHTTNGGDLWSVVTPNSTDVTSGMDAPGNRISFINPSTGWVVKTLTNTNDEPLGAVLYKTTNGGTTWNRIALSTSAGDAGIQVQFVDANNGWVLLYNMNTAVMTFLKTIDGGTTWLPTNGRGIFYYVNATTGYAFSAGDNMAPPYTIFKTNDGGNSWTTQKIDNTAGELMAIHFTDVDNGWIVGEGGKILKTINAGENWTTITNAGLNSNNQNSEVFFLNSSLGWIATKVDQTETVNILKTINGGTNWTTQTLPFNSKVYSMHFWDENNGWATSDRYNNNNVTYDGKIAKYSVYTGTYSNATLNGPWFGGLNLLDPYDDQFGYLVFDGLGHIIDGSQFPSQTSGTYTVNPNGSFTANFINGSENIPFQGYLSSPTEATANAEGMNLNFRKITNPGALGYKIAGTLTTSGGCGQRDVTFTIDSDGVIISSTGLVGPVTGRVYTDFGVFLGHIKTGEPSNGWHLFSIKGYYNSNENKLTGPIDFDWTFCNAGSEANLVRFDNVQSDWTLQTSGTSSSLKSVFFTDANNGYAVGTGQAGQSILKTTNGGNNWTTLNSFNVFTLNSVFSTNANTTYCVGGDGSPNQTIIKTITGGSNWSTLSGIGVVELKSVFFVDSNIGYAVGGANNTGQHIILKTTNGGASWTTQTATTSPNDLAFYSVFFTDENTGYIVGESGMSGTILKTVNGGVNWTQQVSGTDKHLYSVYFIDASTGYIVGNEGVILKTVNGGNNWITQVSGTGQKLSSVNFLNADTGYAVGSFGTVLKTIDGGINWINQLCGTTLNLNSVHFKNNVGYAVGEAGIILKNNNMSLEVQKNLLNKFMTIYPNPNSGTFYFSLKEANSKVKAEIYNISGQKVFEASNFEMQTQNEINFTPKSKGIYFIKINDGENSYSEKIIIQ